MSVPEGSLAVDALMAIAMAREVRDDDFVSQGTAAPLAAVALFLARALDAPNVEFFYQGWVNPRSLDVESLFVRQPTGTVDAPASLSHCALIDLVLKGRCTLQFLRPLQVSSTGDVNTSLIGTLTEPTMRVHGLATADSVGCFERVVLYVTEHSRRVFSDDLAFMTGLGSRDGGNWRTKLRLPGAGPRTIVTPLGIFDFAQEDGRMTARSLFPNVHPDEVAERTGFSVRMPTDFDVFKPSVLELETLVSVDPLGVRQIDFRDHRGDAVRRIDERRRQRAIGHGSRLAPSE